MGYQGIMTNSFIINQRRKDEARAKGLHRMLDFSGMIMTDSGGYQVLEYGKVEVGPLEIAAFQEAIGSNLAVTLDRPTGLSYSRRYAEETVKVSLRNARLTIRKMGDSPATTWMGPIQGGIFPDLVAGCARGLLRAGFRVLALGSPVEVMENYLFATLVKMVMGARTAIPYSVPLHLFGAGHPLLMSLTVALGCDTFDSASYVLYAKGGRYMTERGTTDLRELAFLPCSCPICNATSATELLQLDRKERIRRVSLHNLNILQAEMRRCKQAIVEGRLWDLVEERAASHPSMKAAFRELARHSKLLEGGTPLLKERGLLLRSREDEARPELSQVRDHLPGAMRRRRGTRLAALVQSSEAKPLNRMGILVRLKGLEGASMDVYRLHPWFGLFPAELEFVHPFTQVVTEKVAEQRGGRRTDLRGVLADLRRMGYHEVLVCDENSIRKTVRLIGSHE
jgi:7-cyano-7-deazaguanine tRNA-ribosyltransferase